MDKPLACIFGFSVVLISSESGQSVLEHVNSQRVIAGNHNVDPQVIFKVVD